MNAARIMAVAAGILLLQACGDDAEALSKPQFIEQADAICESTNADLEATFDSFFADMEAEFESDDFDFDDPEFQDRFFATFAETMQAAEPIIDRQLDELRALRPPKEDRELIDGLLDDLETVFEQFADRADAAAAGDASARTFLDEGEDPFAEVNAGARAYGLTECGDPGE